MIAVNHDRRSHLAMSWSCVKQPSSLEHFPIRGVHEVLPVPSLLGRVVVLRRTIRLLRSCTSRLTEHIIGVAYLLWGCLPYWMVPWLSACLDIASDLL